MTSELRNCPHCRQTWPKNNPDHDLRSFRWLGELPRRVTISNADMLIHDDTHGADRFLFAEVKMPWEPTLQIGQARLLKGLARQSRWTVRVLRGKVGAMSVYRVGANGLEAEALETTAAAFRGSVIDWLHGQPWADPRGVRVVPKGRETHTHGWALVEGRWACIQDYYAAGEAPQTACGELWDEAL